MGAKVADISTTSMLNVNIENGSARVSDSLIYYVEGKIGTGSMEFEGEMRTIDLAIETGDFTFRSTFGLEYYNLKLSTNVGSIAVNGEDFGGAYESMSFPTTDLITIDIGTGSIDLDNAASLDNPA